MTSFSPAHPSIATFKPTLAETLQTKPQRSQISARPVPTLAFSNRKTKNLQESFSLPDSFHPSRKHLPNPKQSPSLQAGNFLNNWVQEQRLLGAIRKKDIYAHNPIDSAQVVRDSQGLSTESFEKALRLAALRGDYEAICAILETQPQINVNAVDRQGNTPLMNAIRANEFSDTLNDHSDVDINKTNKKGETALMLAVMSNDPGNARYLLEKHPELGINAMDQSGRTALMIAVQYHKPKQPGHHWYNDPLSYILKFPNVNLHLRDALGRTALDMAIQSGNQKLIDQLKKAPLEQQLPKRSQTAHHPQKNEAFAIVSDSRSVYKQLSKKMHPDQNKASEQMATQFMVRLNEINNMPGEQEAEKLDAMSSLDQEWRHHFSK